MRQIHFLLIPTCVAIWALGIPLEYNCTKKLLVQCSATGTSPQNRQGKIQASRSVLKILILLPDYLNHFHGR